MTMFLNRFCGERFAWVMDARGGHCQTRKELFASYDETMRVSQMLSRRILCKEPDPEKKYGDLCN